MKIRKGRLTDWKEIYEILNSTKELRGSKNRKEEYRVSEVKATINDKRELVLIAEENNELIGLLIAEMWKNKKYSYLASLFVKPEYRKKNVASRLIKEYERRCKKEGIIEIILLTLIDNKKMQSLMNKHKYKQGKKFFCYEKLLK